jgi:L-asparaginase II
MIPLRVARSRGSVVESVHRVSVAVVADDGRLVGRSGDPDLVTWWRSAAKPFQALPLVEDGALDAFGLGSEELALACGSHSSEAVHLAIADRILARIGCTESDLACGPHTPLGPGVAREVAATGAVLTPRWSNCSGKHAGMLALARHHGWPIEGYTRAAHPVQQRILRAIAEWTGVAADGIPLGTDGCTTVCYALPLRRMALAYARLGLAREPGAAAVRDAMLAHPDLVAGERRFCTEAMRALPGQVIVKVGADGIYSASLPAAGVGIALKIEDGDSRSAPLALLAVLRQVARRGLGGGVQVPVEGGGLEPWERLPVRNTRGAVVGEVRAEGAVEFF